MYTFKEILKCLTEELNKEFDPMTYSLWISKNKHVHFNYRYDI